jgi:aminoglycoside 6'-N-acetyltransferase
MAYVQSYVAADVGGGWRPDESDPGTLGTDQFLAHEADLGRGIRTRLLSEFLDMLFQDSTVQRIQVDPTPGNARAIRCYEKVGFCDTASVMTPDGPTRLMVLERATYRERYTPPQGIE